MGLLLLQSECGPCLSRATGTRGCVCLGQWRLAVYRLRRYGARSSNSNHIPWMSGVIAVRESSLGFSPDA